jgi:hypothetical protein
MICIMSKNSIDRANQLASEGRLLDAEDLYWGEIDAGNIEARLSLAFAFHEAGVTSLALAHYSELNGTPYWESAAPQVSDIWLDVHGFREARQALKGLRGEMADGCKAAVQSVETKTAEFVNAIPQIVQGQLVEEQKLLRQLGEKTDLATQIQLVQIREYLAKYASVLASELGKPASQLGIEVESGPGVFVSRKLGDAIGGSDSRWFMAAHAAVNTFTLLFEQDSNATAEFENFALMAMAFIEKKYVVAGRKLTEIDEEFVVNNLIWALNLIDHPAKDFYAHLLPE